MVKHCDICSAEFTTDVKKARRCDACKAQKNREAQARYKAAKKAIVTTRPCIDCGTEITRPITQPSRCPACHHKRFYKDTPKRRQLRRIKTLKQYNLTPEEFDKLRAKQNYLCAICGVHESTCIRKNRKGEEYATLRIDHNHTTGQVRGLLCDRCNRAIGLLQDDIMILDKAAQYLKEHNL